MGWDNTDKFFKPDTPTQQWVNEFEKLPEEVQQAAIPDLQVVYNQAAQLTQRMMQNQQLMQQQGAVNG